MSAAAAATTTRTTTAESLMTSSTPSSSPPPSSRAGDGVAVLHRAHHQQRWCQRGECAPGSRVGDVHLGTSHWCAPPRSGGAVLSPALRAVSGAVDGAPVAKRHHAELQRSSSPVDGGASVRTTTATTTTTAAEPSSPRIPQHELRSADFSREAVLGEGSYSIVTLATHRASGLRFALKEIDRGRLRWRPLEMQLRWEINLQRTLRHPHIVRLYSYFITSDCISLVLEYCGGGTLQARVKAAPQRRLSERHASRYTRHVAKALVHLHDRGVAHRDLKLENVLIDADGVAKLADFGWSREVVSSATPLVAEVVAHGGSAVEAAEETEGRRTVCGTLDYLSPEMVRGDPHSAKTDVWSLGVMLAEMLTGTPPFYAPSTQDTLYAIRCLPPNLTPTHASFSGGHGCAARSAGEPVATAVDSTVEPPVLSAAARSLIDAMLQKDPAVRPTMKEVLCHPWMQKTTPLPAHLAETTSA
ncbi:serine/threonine-protein kinase [Novymonas esmeraldas]|uniref:Serine/threonine-protein kinase n=1 Tax=Novymonas esmeraldas TaxID=1808958 RepID=A0AAW0F4I0_9TRYP